MDENAAMNERCLTWTTESEFLFFESYIQQDRPVKYKSSFKCGGPSGECEVQSAECEVRSAEFEVQNAKCDALVREVFPIPHLALRTWHLKVPGNQSRA